MSKTIIPAFSLSRCTCEALTDEQKANLLNHINLIKGNVEQLLQEAQQLERCDKVTQVLMDAKKMLVFLESMQQILTADCLGTIIIGPTIFQTNLYAKNWILGNYTTDDLVDIYNSRSVKYDNITNCPINTPFFDGQKCITCPTGNPVFNIQTLQCGQCPHNEHVDNIHKRCVHSGASSTVFNSNSEAGQLVAPEGYKENPSYRTCPP